MRDDGPRPQAVEMELDGVGLGARLLQGVDGPHGEVGHQQEGHELAPRLAADLIRRDARAPRRVQHEHRLTRGLQERGERRDQHEDRVLLDREVAADDREGAVDEETRLRADQQDVVQLQVPSAVVLELSHLRTHRARRRPASGDG